MEKANGTYNSTKLGLRSHCDKPDKSHWINMKKSEEKSCGLPPMSQLLTDNWYTLLSEWPQLFTSESKDVAPVFKKANPVLFEWLLRGQKPE